MTRRPWRSLRRLGENRCAAITLVSADAAEWIANVVGARCKNAELCLAPAQIRERLRPVFALKGPEGVALLDAWLKWARRCRIPPS